MQLQIKVKDTRWRKKKTGKGQRLGQLLSGFSFLKDKQRLRVSESYP